jgi:RimJ/RimL family protein N-acetyltransferase
LTAKFHVDGVHSSMLLTETPRLLLRTFHIGDVDAMAAIFADPQGHPFGPGPKTRKWTEQWVLGCLDHYYQQWGFGPWAVVGRAQRELIGFCGLSLHEDFDGRREVELGYRLARAWWGKGLATEAAAAVRDVAFDELGLERIVSRIDPRNTASCRVAEKIGMRLEREALDEHERVVRHYALDRRGKCV